jgi:DNA polymerase-1
MQQNLLIVDGHNLLFQMFFGMPNRILGKNNKPVQGVVGFIGALLKVIKFVNAHYAIVVFDGETQPQRKELDANYKANRVDYTNVAEEENPFAQLEYIKAVLHHLNIMFVESEEGVEADDIIAHLTYKHKYDKNIFIMSKDTDFFQLLNNFNVAQVFYKGKNTSVVYEADVILRCGVLCQSYAHYKALVGDSSDNLKGVPKVGPKTAAKLMNEFGTLNNIYNNINSVTPLKLQDSLTLHKELVFRNFQLIKLEPRPCTIEDSQMQLPQDIQNKKTIAALKELEIL